MKPKIVLDLELEQPKTRPDTFDSQLDEEKIIQVGWIVVDSSTGFVLVYRCYHVNIGVPLSGFIKQLTGITDDDIMNGTDLKSIYEQLKKDREAYDAERMLYTWGAGDQLCLQKELGYPEDWCFGRSAFNVKHLYRAYADINGINSSGGLKRSMGRLGLKWDKSAGEKHNACADSLNTAIMFRHIQQKLKE